VLVLLYIINEPLELLAFIVFSTLVCATKIFFNALAFLLRVLFTITLLRSKAGVVLRLFLRAYPRVDNTVFAGTKFTKRSVFCELLQFRIDLFHKVTSLKRFETMISAKVVSCSSMVK
jgi:hypothetical protein